MHTIVPKPIRRLPWPDPFFRAGLMVAGVWLFSAAACAALL